MIASRGFGLGAIGTVAVLGFCLTLEPVSPDQPSSSSGVGPVTPSRLYRRNRDDLDILELLPIFVEILNGRR